MRWMDLITEMCNCTYTIYYQNDADAGYASISWLPPKGCEKSGDALYFCTSQQLEEDDSRIPISAIILGEPSIRKTGFEKIKNAAIFHEKKEFDNAYNILMNAFSKSRKLDALLQDITFTLNDGRGLSAAVELISDHFKMPVNIVDRSFSILAVSNKYVPNAPSLQKDISENAINLNAAKQIRSMINRMRSNRQSGSAPQPLVSQIVNVQLAASDEYTDTLVISPAASEKYRNYVTPIFQGNVTIGYFSVIAEDDLALSSVEISYLSKIAVPLSMEMQKADFYKANKASYYTQILSRVFSGEPFSEKDITQRLQLFGFNLKPLLYVILVQVDNPRISSNELNNIAKSIVRYLGNGIYVIMNGELVILHSRNHADTVNETLLDDWNNDFGKYGITAGISSVFVGISDAENYRKQADAAIRTGKNAGIDKSLYDYDSLRPKHISSVLSKTAPFPIFCHPEVLRLVRYDEIHGTDYSKLLRKYVNNPKNPAKIAEELHIHRNTFYQRLNKIQSLIDVDLDSGVFLTEASLTFLLLEEHHNI